MPHLRQFAAAQEFGHSISPRVWGDDLMNLYGVISQEVVQYEFSRVPEQSLCVIPEAEEAQDFAVMVQELLQSVTSLIWPKWLHTFLNLNQGTCEIRGTDTIKHVYEN